ncbi:hypothetical protein ANTPLA_LOCUS3677 [Anthophora plagiata]
MEVHGGADGTANAAIARGDKQRGKEGGGSLANSTANKVPRKTKPTVNNLRRWSKVKQKRRRSITRWANCDNDDGDGSGVSSRMVSLQKRDKYTER